MTTDKHIREIAEIASDLIVCRLPEKNFEYDYLIACIMEAIENSIKQ